MRQGERQCQGLDPRETDEQTGLPGGEGVGHETVGSALRYRYLRKWEPRYDFYKMIRTLEFKQ